MRVLRSRKRWVAATVGVVAVGTFAAVAIAALGTFTATTLVTANLTGKVQINNDRVKFQTKDPTDVRVQHIVVTAGGTSGWHHHPGMVIVAVASGSVTVWDSNCNQTSYGPGLANGSVFTESGDEPGQVTGGSSGAETYATLIAPHVSPPANPVYSTTFRINDNPPPCAG